MSSWNVYYHTGRVLDWGERGVHHDFSLFYFIAYAVFLYKVCFLLNRIKPFSHFVLASTLSSGQYKKTVCVKYSKIQLFNHFKNIFKKKFILYAPFAITVYVVAPSVARQSWGDWFCGAVENHCEIYISWIGFRSGNTINNDKRRWKLIDL